MKETKQKWGKEGTSGRERERESNKYFAINNQEEEEKKHIKNFVIEIFFFLK